MWQIYPERLVDVCVPLFDGKWLPTGPKCTTMKTRICMKTPAAVHFLFGTDIFLSEHTVCNFEIYAHCHSIAFWYSIEYLFQEWGAEVAVISRNYLVSKGQGKMHWWFAWKNFKWFMAHYMFDGSNIFKIRHISLNRVCEILYILYIPTRKQYDLKTFGHSDTDTIHSKTSTAESLKFWNG